jgi:hypothetical protein
MVPSIFDWRLRIEESFRVVHFNWSPGIGDPTAGGWVTVALYLIASVSCWKTARKLRFADMPMRQERYAWRAISALFLALGINKQLDLQSALTQVGRILSFYEGWYAQRQAVQVVFIILVAVLCVVAVIILMTWAHNAPAPTWVALMGTMLVFGFVLIRASSFHHMDRFIGELILGLRWNWVLEMGGISLALVASEWRRRRKAEATA